jgi:tetratricopeptide (TPR) repeat protein
VLKGESELNTGKTSEALQSFESALRIDSTETNALFYAGRIYEFEGNLAMANARYKQFLRNNKEESEINDSVKVFVKRIDIKLNNK